jgi:serine/threonine protein kinase
MHFISWKLHIGILKYSILLLKSANIFLMENGMAKLGDFNVSIVLGKGMMCETQTGAPYYASP